MTARWTLTRTAAEPPIEPDYECGCGSGMLADCHIPGAECDCCRECYADWEEHQADMAADDSWRW